MNLSIRSFFLVLLLLQPMAACKQEISCHEEMKLILTKMRKNALNKNNQYHSAAKLAMLDSLLLRPQSTPDQIRYCRFLKAKILTEVGEEKEAITILEKLLQDGQVDGVERVISRELALAYLRLGERSNCIVNHASASCILPIKGAGIHTDTTGSRKAIAAYEKLLGFSPRDMELRWLLNLSYMTLGKYPAGVPKKFLIPDMEGDTTYKVKAFQDIAADLKLDIKNMAGGSITEDFDNDGYLDLITSGWGIEDELHYFKNNADGTFSDMTDKTGLQGITGGLNIMQTDYNNDGHKDIFILRGGWKNEFGKEPNSLIRNNGDGTFTDVTTISGLLSFHPTQTATWNDFNNDGWLDVFIGNESSKTQSGDLEIHPCELYINNQDGTFREIAEKAHCNFVSFVKGVTSGDYDHDGKKDIFLSTMNNGRFLLKNMGTDGGDVEFANVTERAGLGKEVGASFPTWFWDYDNDGWLDIFACDYTFQQTLAHYAAAEKLGVPAGNPEKMLLYHNNHDGTFTNVANEVGLTQVVFAMGSNFGDIDNDGFLDMYLGTGNPSYESLIPNKMFKNLGGEKFADVTASARVGHLQKGHAVSFADMDNDGDQDIYIEMGGAFSGDAYENSFFMNPGQNNNSWICLDLVGTIANRAAIGTELKLTFTENGVTRSVYRDVNSGGSFGSSPLRREIGIGQATQIDELVVRWAGGVKVQTFKNIKPNQFLRITEGSMEIEKVNLKPLTWMLPNLLCGPLAMN